MNLTKNILLALLCMSLFCFSCNGDDDEGNSGQTNDDLPRLTVNNVTLFEGDENTVFTFRVGLSSATDKEVSFDYATEEVTAGFDIDFVPVSGNASIPAGERETSIDVTLVTDIIREQDEQFKFVISNAVNASISSAEGLGTIRNDDDFVEVPEDGYITPENYVGFTKVFADEFDGSEINLDNWTHEIGAGGWGNEESQYYTDRSANSVISNGNLVITAREESFQGAPYTSARIISKDKQEYRWGRVDVRAVLPEGQGIWPAIWMLGHNISEVGWPHCGEIDIMELLGHEPSKVHGTAHWGPQGQTFSFFKGESFELDSDKFSESYNVFSIDWEPDRITYMVNDEVYFTLSPDLVNGNYPFNQEFFFLFNIAVGGEWPGYPDASTQFPQQMLIDYIRVFQRD